MLTHIAEQLDPIFKPKSIAIIGASNDPTKWGGRVLKRLLESNFRGKIYPVNPKQLTIFGIRAYSDIIDIPDSVDLAVFTIQAAGLPDVMKRCVQKGVKGGIVISADFAETGEDGRALQDETVSIARSGGLRFVGPNGNGVWSSSVGMNITPFPTPRTGTLAFVSQSGMFGGLAERISRVKEFGMSKFISIGNQADLTMSDYLSYLAVDNDTQVIALYLEGVKDGQQLIKTAADVSKIKPVLILKGGSSKLGARATLSHTASIAGEDNVFNAMCRQAGLIRVSQLEHLFIMAEALIKQPLPAANRIAIIGNGGQSVTTADNLAALGVDVPEFQEEDKVRLKSVLPPHAPVPCNPLDFAAGAVDTPGEVHVVNMVASLNYIDGIITNVPTEVVFNASSFGERKKILIDALEEFCRIPEKYGKPVITQRMMPSETVVEMLQHARIPMYNTTEQCALAMSALTKYAEIKNRS
jgi:acyl-CoA synthetase (NDP forming)